MLEPGATGASTMGKQQDNKRQKTDDNNNEQHDIPKRLPPTTGGALQGPPSALRMEGATSHMLMRTVSNLPTGNTKYPPPPDSKPTSVGRPAANQRAPDNQLAMRYIS